MLDLSSFEKAIISLKKAVTIANTTEFTQNLSSDQRDVIRAGVIQNFEFTYELSWKFLKRFLKATSPENIDHLSIKDLFRVGFEQGFILNPEKWFLYLNHRNLTSHTYNEVIAEEIYKLASDFLIDAENLYHNLKQKNA